MKRMILISAISSVLALMPGILTAAGRTTPPGGTWAAGAGVGFANPLDDDDFDAEPTGEIYLEYFFVPHFSARATLSFIEFDGEDIPGIGPDDVDIQSFTTNGIYQWEGGVVHPFVTAGIGMYRYDSNIDDSDIEPGLNGGGGLNFYLSDNFAIKTEVLGHVTDGREPDAYLTGTVGARWLWGD